MAEIISVDDIDFAKYEQETDTQQKVKPAALYVAEIIDRLKHPVKTVRHYMPWRKTRKAFAFYPGQVTVWAGANGGGKSLITGQVALHLCAQGQKVCVASFEMPPADTLESMGRQWSGENPDHPAYRGMPEATARLVDIYEQFQDWTTGKLWLYDQCGTVDVRQVTAFARYCAKERGITQIFVDNLGMCVKGEDDYNGQKEFIAQMKAIAKDYAIHIHVVHHIKKPDTGHGTGAGNRVTRYAIKGSGAISDFVDNCIMVVRDEQKEMDRDAGKPVEEAKRPDTFLIVDKNRKMGWRGTIGLWFDRESRQFIGAFGEEVEPMYVEREYEPTAY